MPRGSGSIVVGTWTADDRLADSFVSCLFGYFLGYFFFVCSLSFLEERGTVWKGKTIADQGVPSKCTVRKGSDRHTYGQ